jgi:hypothetical protein
MNQTPGGIFMDGKIELKETHQTLIGGDEVRSCVSENNYSSSDIKCIVVRAFGRKEINLGEIQKLLNQVGL